MILLFSDFPGNWWLLVLPFLIELFGDDYLIKKEKKDISIWVRIFMILVICLPIPGNPLKPLIIATLPYVFFDPAINLLRGKKLLYSGKTKKYDLFLGMFNPWLVLLARVVCFIVLLVIYFNL